MRKYLNLCIILAALAIIILILPHANASDSLYNREDAIIFNLDAGNVIFTDETYSGFDEDGNPVTGTHRADNLYVVEQTSEDVTHYTIAVGTPTTPVSKKFEIHMRNLNVQGPKTTDNHAAPVYVNTSADTVYLILDNKTESTLISYAQLFVSSTSKTLLSESLRFGHAAIEKEIETQGTLVVTCEEGHRQHLQGNTKGHNCTANGACGSLYAEANSDSKFNTAGNTRTAAAAAIGSKAELSEKANKRTTLTSAPTMGKLYNLTIAGGKITAKGAPGNSNTINGVKVYLGGSPGIGVGAGLQQYSIGYAVDNLFITGGYIDAIAGDGSSANIGGGYHAGYVRLYVYGGTANATKQRTANTDIKRGPGLGGGGGGATSNATAGATVRIYDGTVTATSQYGAAIGSGAGGNNGIGQTAWVYIYGGNIDARTTKGDGNGAGAAIGSGGSSGAGKGGNANVYIYGGDIFASSELGADIGGGGTRSTTTSGVGGESTISISGGNIIAMTGGIGGGNANAGTGGKTTLTISGGNIKASHISGGNSVSNNGGSATVTISNGTLHTGFIGGGNSEQAKIGSAAVTVEGGDIFGQIIMDSTNLASGAQCFFRMSAGTINLASPNDGYQYTRAYPNGGAVYIIGGNSDGSAIATISGGTIKNANATYGGAIYIADGGSMLMTGGIIEACSAEMGGAIYIDGGNFIMSGGDIKQCQATISGGGLYVAGGNISMTGGSFDNNDAAQNGGAIYMYTETVDIEIDIEGGSIVNNFAGNHAGAIGVYANGNCNVNVNIGLQECLGQHPAEHEEACCPTITNNTATRLGGALCLHGQSDALAVNVWCGFIQDNIAIRNPGSNSLNQSGGTVTIWGGSIAPGLMVGGGIYDDNRLQADQMVIRLWANYDGGPTEPQYVEVTVGVTMVFPLDTYDWSGHKLTGWTSAPDNSGFYIPAQGQHSIELSESGYLDFYAVWDQETEYTIYIPDSLQLDENGTGEITLSADLRWFTAHSDLSIYINSDFLLQGAQSGYHVPYIVTSSEFGKQYILKNDDVAATYQYNNTQDKVLSFALNGSGIYAEQYSDIITFVIVYSEQESVSED